MSNEVEHKHHVRIHIDQKPHESPDPTTGEALYKLGEVPAGLELYREVGGNREDRSVPNTAEIIHLEQDEHFHSGPPPEFTIIVNGKQKTVKGESVSYSEVVQLGFKDPPTGPNISFSITYEDGPHANPQGSLSEGGHVKVKDGMIFNVTPTDKS